VGGKGRGTRLLARNSKEPVQNTPNNAVRSKQKKKEIKKHRLIAGTRINTTPTQAWQGIEKIGR